MEDHTAGGGDLLILCGQFPDTIYQPGNAQADDSLAELFLDAGNSIFNTGDYMFYIVQVANGALLLTLVWVEKTLLNISMCSLCVMFLNQILICQYLRLAKEKIIRPTTSISMEEVQLL